MSKQIAKSALASKLDAKTRERYEENKAKAPEPDAGTRLPAGIENGIAQLRTCKFGIYQKGDFTGEYFFQATGRVVEPAEVNGVPVRGLITRLGPIPICDTPKNKKSQADHFDDVRQILARLKGGTLEEYGVDEVEALAELVEEAKPFFRFRTWVGSKQEVKAQAGKWYLFNVDKDGKPVGAPTKGPYASEALAKAANPFAGREPRVNEIWGDLVEYVPSDDAVAGAMDEEIESTGQDEPADADDDKQPADDANVGTTDLRGFLEAAARNDGDDPECVSAQQAIIDVAAPLGIDADKYDTWEEVVDAIEEQTGDAGPQTDEPQDDVPDEPEPWQPSKGETLEAKLKGAKKAVKVKVTSVDAKGETVTVQRLDNKALVKGVLWTQLIHD